MDVFLIPVPGSRYELYFEPRDEADEVEEGHGRGWISRARQRFTAMLREAEQEWHLPTPGAEPDGFTARLRRRVMRWVVTRIVEQRMLWHLRKAHAATAHIPEDLPAERASEIIRRALKADVDRHFRWLLINLVGLLAVAPLALVPGPNVLGYYFTFTVVGHFFAYRGARHGLTEVTWRYEPNAALLDLRGADGLDPPQRERRVKDVAERLRLARLVTFFERIAVPTA